LEANLAASRDHDTKETKANEGEKGLEERVGELELELAEAKLARVEAECKAQVT